MRGSRIRIIPREWTPAKLAQRVRSRGTTRDVPCLIHGGARRARCRRIWWHPFAWIRMESSARRKRQAAGPRFRQTSPGLYVPSSVNEGVVEQRIFEQGHRIRSYGAVTGWAALRWRGAAFFDGVSRGGVTLPVPLVVGKNHLAKDPRVSISEAHIAPSERTWNGGIWCATVQRALFDEMRHARGVRSAVVAMDMAAAAWTDLSRPDDPVRRAQTRLDGCSSCARGAGIGLERQLFAPGDRPAPDLGDRRAAGSTAVQPTGLRSGRQSAGISGPPRSGVRDCG